MGLGAAGVGATLCSSAGDASAVAGSAGGDSAPCRAGHAEHSAPSLPGGLSTGALSARTAADDRAPAQASAAAHETHRGLSRRS